MHYRTCFFAQALFVIAAAIAALLAAYASGQEIFHETHRHGAHDRDGSRRCH